MPNCIVVSQTIRAYVHRSAEKIGPLTSRLSRSLKFIWTDTDPSLTYDFLLVIHILNNYGFLLYRFRGNGLFQSKNVNFPITLYIKHPNEGVFLELCNADWAPQTRVWMNVQSLRLNNSVGQTDRQKCHINIILNRDENASYCAVVKINICIMISNGSLLHCITWRVSTCTVVKWQDMGDRKRIWIYVKKITGTCSSHWFFERLSVDSV